MDEKRHTELDRLFQSRLKNIQDNDSEWNLPSEDIFDAAMEEIDSQESSNKRFIFLWISGISLVLLLALLGFWNWRTLDQIDQKMNRMIEMQETQNENTFNSSEPKNENTNPFFEPEESFENTKPLVTNSSKNTNNSKANFIKEVTTTQPIKVTAPPINLEDDKNYDLLAGTKFKKPNNKRLDYELDFIPIKLNLDYDKNTIQKSDAILFNERKKWKINFVQFGVNQSRFKMESNNPEAIKLQGYEQWELGFDAGISVQKEWRKYFFIDGQLKVSRLNNSSQYQSNMAYNKAMETINSNGEKEYVTPVQIISVSGEHLESMELNVANENIQDQENLKQITDVENQISLISGGIGVGRKLPISKRIDLAPNVGVKANLMLKASEEMESKIYLENKMLGSSQIQHPINQDLNTLFLSWNLALNLNYHITSNWQIAAGLSFEKSFQSIQKNKSTPLNLEQRGSHIRIGYQF